MKIKYLLLIISLVAISITTNGQKISDEIKFESELDSISYMIGIDVGKNLKKSAIEEINYINFINGMIDAIEQKDLKIDEKAIMPYMQKYFQALQAKQQKKANEKNQANLEEGRAFLEQNAKREGVITTASGLQYEIITEGTGKSPSKTDVVVCHYKGMLIDGTVFDSSIERGQKFESTLNGVIKGWIEGMQLMKEGSKYKFYIPTELAYGTRVRPGGPIQPNMALIFEIELFEVKTP